MHVEILTPDKNLFSGEARSLQLPGSDGKLGVLENHAPLITTLRKGVIKLDGPEGVRLFEVNGGVVEVLRNKVVILAE